MNLLKAAGGKGGTFEDHQILDAAPLADPFDPEHEGGVVVLDDGTVAEVKHPYWVATTPSPPGERATALPYRLQGDNTVVFTGPDFDPRRVSRGGESEISVTRDNRPYRISPDGVHVQWPAGRPRLMSALDFDPEALQFQVETATKVAYSPEEHGENLVWGAHRVDRLLGAYGLAHAGLALHPYAHELSDWSDYWYVRDKVMPKMPFPLEFGVMSNQLTIGINEPNAALDALNRLQIYNAALSWLSESAAIRDGSFETTIGQHYGSLENMSAEPGKAAYLPTDHQLWEYADFAPHDWRELARYIGSPSAGAFREPAPADILTFLQKGDALLRDGTIPTTGRTLGMHPDRMRERGLVELCAIAPSGGNLYRTRAIHELAANFMITAMVEYSGMTPTERQMRAQSYPRQMGYAHDNNMQVALHGREADLLRANGSTGKPHEIVADMIQYVNAREIQPLSNSAMAELLATITDNPYQNMPRYTSAKAWFDAYFSPGSGITASEALRYAHQQEPHIPVPKLLEAYSQARADHTHRLAREFDMVLNGQVIVYA